MAYRIVEIDPPGDEPGLLWDTTFGFFPNDGHGDWALAGSGERQNVGGLQSTAPIETAIALCLMTDARARAADGIPSFVDDPRGWWGDRIDVDESRGEQELGSRLWTLQWARIAENSAETVRRAEDLAREALATLITQRVVQRIDVRGEVDVATGRIDLDVRAYGAVGARPIARRFALVWERHSGLSDPLAR